MRAVKLYPLPPSIVRGSTIQHKKLALPKDLYRRAVVMAWKHCSL